MIVLMVLIILLFQLLCSYLVKVKSNKNVYATNIESIGQNYLGFLLTICLENPTNVKLIEFAVNQYMWSDIIIVRGIGSHLLNQSPSSRPFCFVLHTANWFLRTITEWDLNIGFVSELNCSHDALDMLNTRILTSLSHTII